MCCENIRASIIIAKKSSPRDNRCKGYVSRGSCSLITNLFYHFYYSGESLWIVHSEVGKYFAIELDVVFVQLAHKDRVGDAIDAATCVDTVDPQRTELSFLGFSIAVGVGLTFFPLVLGYCPNVFTSAPITFGAIEDFLSACS